MTLLLVCLGVVIFGAALLIWSLCRAAAGTRPVEVNEDML